MQEHESRSLNVEEPTGASATDVRGRGEILYNGSIQSCLLRSHGILIAGTQVTGGTTNLNFSWPLNLNTGIQFYNSPVYSITDIPHQIPLESLASFELKRLIIK